MVASDDRTAADTAMLARRAAQFSKFYSLISCCYKYPRCEIVKDIIENESMDYLGAMTRLTDINFDIVRDALAALSDRNHDLRLEYTRLFDIGGDSATCSLYGGEYVGSRMRTMEDAVRFYNYFGLTTVTMPREMPDHIVTELEFMHYLSFNEAVLVSEGVAPESFRCAQRDFLVRHLCRWIPILQARLEECNASQFYIVITKLLSNIATKHLSYLEAAIKGIAKDGYRMADVIVSDIVGFHE